MFVYKGTRFNKKDDLIMLDLDEIANLAEQLEMELVDKNPYMMPLCGHYDNVDDEKAIAWYVKKFKKLQTQANKILKKTGWYNFEGINISYPEHRSMIINDAIKAGDRLRESGYWDR